MVKHDEAAVMMQSVLKFRENCLRWSLMITVLLGVCAFGLAACASAQNAPAAVSETATPSRAVTRVPTLVAPRFSQTPRALPTSTAETSTPTPRPANETPSAVPTFGVEIDVTVGDNGLRL